MEYPEKKNHHSIRQRDGTPRSTQMGIVIFLTTYPAQHERTHKSTVHDNSAGHNTNQLPLPLRSSGPHTHEVFSHPSFSAEGSLPFDGRQPGPYRSSATRKRPPPIRYLVIDRSPVRPSLSSHPSGDHSLPAHPCPCPREMIGRPTLRRAPHSTVTLLLRPARSGSSRSESAWLGPGMRCCG